MVSIVLADLIDRLAEELRNAPTGLSPKAEAREAPWVQGSGYKTGWDFGPFAAMLAPGHTSPGATKYKETLG